LVIVIAVIAILAAILIPVISNLVRRARVVYDSQLVRNLNTALAADKDHPKHENMQQALDAAEAFGYDVTKINASATDNLILWDSVNDVFCYMEKAEDGTETITYIPESVDKVNALSANDYRLWMISSAVSDKYSTYYTGTATNVNVTTGFDAGHNTTLESISYTNPTAEAKNVVIRTNSFDTTLTVNAPKDTVKHYDKVGSLNVIAVANASYHENGEVKFVEISNGRIVLEENSEVDHIHLTATEGNFNDITIAKSSNVEMPDFSRDPVEIPAEGKLVVALQDGTDKDDAKDYVWLTAVGIYEQVTVSDSKTDAKDNFAATSITASQEQKTAAQQIANNISATVGGNDYTLTATPIIENNVVTGWNYSLESEEEAVADITEDVTIAQQETVVTVKVSDVAQETTKENGADKETVQKGATLFAGGKGTEKDPYLISNRSEFENMSTIKSYSYFKWVGDSTIDASNWSNSNTLVGSFDGNGVTFNNLDSVLIRNVLNGSESENPAEDTVNVYTIKNLTINANIVTDGWIAGVVRTAGVHNFVMENVNVHGYIEGSTGVASFICFGAGNCHPSWAYDGHITFKNCNSDAIIYAKSGNAVGFIAHAMMASSAGTITLENSNYTGLTSATGVSACKYICGNWLNGSIVDDQSSAKNNVVYKTSDNGWSYKAEGKTGSFTVKTGTMPSNIGDVFVLNAESNATKAIISLVISPNPGNLTSTYMTEEVNVVDGKVTSENVKYFTIRINANGVTEAGAHGNYYDVKNSIFNGKLGSSTIVRITQYNATGSILSITNYYFNDAD
jgi:hypothetical protein